MPNIGLPELIVILLIILVLFGSSRLPGLARSIRESRDELRKGAKGESKKEDEKTE